MSTDLHDKGLEIKNEMMMMMIMIIIIIIIIIINYPPETGRSC